jgi:hypothetical protein
MVISEDIFEDEVNGLTMEKITPLAEDVPTLGQYCE